MCLNRLRNFKNRFQGSTPFLENHLPAESSPPQPLYLAPPLSSPTCHFQCQILSASSLASRERGSGPACEIGCSGVNAQPWSNQLYVVEQNRTKHSLLCLPASLFSQGLCMGQFAWVAKAIMKTSCGFWAGLGGGGGNLCDSKFPVDKKSGWIFGKAQQMSVLSGPSALTERKNYSIAI